MAADNINLRPVYLYLPANVPTNLELLGDTVELGPNFQGGAVTDLSIGWDADPAFETSCTITETLTDDQIAAVAANVVVVSQRPCLLMKPRVFLRGKVSVDSGGIFNVINPGGNMYDDIRLRSRGDRGARRDHEL